MTHDYPHQGITMHRLRVGGDPAGFIFAIGVVVIFLIGIPTAWEYLGIAVVAGAAVALLLGRRKPMKIVTLGDVSSRTRA